MTKLDSRGIWAPAYERRKAALDLADCLEAIGTFPAQVKRLRTCGQGQERRDGTPVFLYCGQAFCPICQPRWQSRMSRTWRPKIDAILAGGGAVVAVTLTHRPGNGTLRDQRLAFRKQVGKLFDRRAWKGRGGFIHRVGILLVIEIGTDGLCDGLVHLHALVASADAATAIAAGAWMRDTWLDLHPDASVLGQDLSLCDGPSALGKWLNYILGGGALVLDWDSGRMGAMVQASLNVGYRLTSYGLLSPRRRQGATVPGS